MGSRNKESRAAAQKVAVTCLWLASLAIVDALMLMMATTLAFLFAIKRKIALHRQWATRSYAIALVFIAGFVMGVTGWEALGVEIVQAIIWSCLAMSVLLGDVAIHWKEISAAVSIPVKAEKKETVPRGVIRAT